MDYAVAGTFKQMATECGTEFDGCSRGFHILSINGGKMESEANFACHFLIIATSQSNRSSRAAEQLTDCAFLELAAAPLSSMGKQKLLSLSVALNFSAW